MSDKNEHLSVTCPSRFFSALRESFSAVITSINELPDSAKALYGTSLAVVLSGLCYLSPVQALGAVAGGIVVMAMTFRQNHHIRAQQAVGQTLFALHLALLSAWPAVLQSSLTALRCAFISTLPEECPKIRIVAGTVGFFFALVIFFSCFEVFPLTKLSNVPIAVMALVSAAEAFPTKHSWATRLCYLAAAAFLIPYHLFTSGSWMGTATNTFAVGTLIRSIYKNDIL